VTVKRDIGDFLVRAVGVAAFSVMLLSGSPASAQSYANADSWMKFGEDSSNDWDTGFDRSFAQQWETQPQKGYPTLSMENLGPMRAAIRRYADIVAQGGWDSIPLVELKLGMNHPAVVAVRRRLEMEGDMKRAGGSQQTFDSYVEKGVKSAQQRNGLTPTGVLDKATIYALNVPASARLRQLRTNLVRIESLAAPSKGRYVVVNIPAAQIEAVENNEVVSRHAGVVGKVDRQTPILKSGIHELNFNKEWILPPTVITQDFVPKLRDKNKIAEVIKKYGVDIYQDHNGYAKKRPLDPYQVDWHAPQVKNYFFSQKPGPENPLGFVKINFGNPYSVYMHDTPGKSIFANNFRAESSGCVRVQNIPQLAAWLLRDNGWDLSRVNEMKQTGETLNVTLKQRVPLYFAYVTSWATPDGMAQFRRDLYNRDGVGATATAY
jgi:murein L,D-transpeptidase YcbB/YkuD